VVRCGFARFHRRTVERPRERHRERRRIAQQVFEAPGLVSQLGQRVLLEQRVGEAGQQRMLAVIGLE
jgi:hypothetical protein